MIFPRKKTLIFEENAHLKPNEKYGIIIVSKNREKGGYIMSAPCFQKGDYVIYKNNGLCRVEDIQPLTFDAMKREYYILSPQSGGTVYVPTEGELAKKLQKAPTKQDVDDLIAGVENTDLKWIENSKQRIATFDKLLASSDRTAILWIMKVLSEQKDSEAKRLSSNEERILATAEKIIKEEFAFALNIPKDQVIAYILAQIQA